MTRGPISAVFVLEVQSIGSIGLTTSSCGINALCRLSAVCPLVCLLSANDATTSQRAHSLRPTRSLMKPNTGPANWPATKKADSTSASSALLRRQLVRRGSSNTVRAASKVAVGIRYQNGGRKHPALPKAYSCTCCKAASTCTATSRGTATWRSHKYSSRHRDWKRCLRLQCKLVLKRNTRMVCSFG